MISQIKQPFWMRWNVTEPASWARVSLFGRACTTNFFLFWIELDIVFPFVLVGNWCLDRMCSPYVRSVGLCVRPTAYLVWILPERHLFEWLFELSEQPDFGMNQVWRTATNQVESNRKRPSLARKIGAIRSRYGSWSAFGLRLDRYPLTCPNKFGLGSFRFTFSPCFE